MPVLVQATPDTPGLMTIKDRRDSFCGKMSACNNLTQYGIPYSLTTRHTEAPDSEFFRHDLEWFAGVCRVVRGLRRLRIGAIGARPAAFNTVRYSEKILEANGISIEPIDLSEILGRIARMKDDDPAAVAKLESINRYVSTDSVPRDALLKMAKLGAVIDDWMAQTEVAISAVQCWTSLEEYFGVVPCTVMSMMSENLMSSACEVDICGVIGMHALQLASGTPSALLDWNNNYGEDPDKAVCFHCSNLPKHFFREVKMDFQQIIAGTVGRENTYGTCVGLVKSGPMSFARFSTDGPRGQDRRLRWRGRVHGRSARYVRRRGCGEDRQSAGSAAVHLRARLRTSRGCQSGPRLGGRTRSGIAIPGLERASASVGRGSETQIATDKHG